MCSTTRLPGRILLTGAILLGALLLQAERLAYGAGCTDVYDGNGSSVDTLANHLILATIPAQLNRSLCGFYDADYIEFTGESGVSYEIQVLNHEDPAHYGIYLELWEQQAPSQYHLLLSTPPASIALNSPTTFTGNLVVRVGSLRSDTGSYGGGDYNLSIAPQQSPTALPTTLPTATTAVTPTVTPTTSPTTTPTATLSIHLLLPLCQQSEPR